MLRTKSASLLTVNERLDLSMRKQRGGACQGRSIRGPIGDHENEELAAEAAGKGCKACVKLSRTSALLSASAQL